MKRKALALLCFVLIACTLSGCVTLDFSPRGYRGDARIKAEGATEERTMDVGSFDSIVIEGNMLDLRVHLSNGENEMRISCDRAYFDSFRLDNNDHTLYVDTEGTMGERIDMYIAAPEFDSIDCRGAAEFSGEGLAGEDLIIGVAGACSGSLGLDYTEVDVELSGAGSLALSGKTDRLNITCAGACDIRAKELTTRICKVSLAGAGGVEIRCEEKLDATIGGIGTIDYWGSPEVRKVAGGIGTVTRKGD